MARANSLNPQQLNEFCTIGAFILSFNDESDAAAAMRMGMMDQLKPEMFQDAAHRDIWKALREGVLAGEKTDAVLLAARLRTSNSLADAGGVEYIGRLLDETPAPSNGVEYARNVADFWRRRTLAGALNRVAREVEAIPDDQPFDHMAIIDRTFRTICESADVATVELLMGFLEDGMEMRPKLEAPIVTRIAKLDGNVNLFQPGELTILAARPSIGKSTLARQMCRNAAVRGDILVFSMEVPPKVLALQFACEVSGVPYYDYTRGVINDDQVLAVLKSQEDPNLKRLHVYKGGQPSVLDVSLALTSLKARGVEIAAVVIDYLGLMKHDKAERWDLAVGNTTRALKQLAIQRNVPIIVLAQLNREVEKRGGASDCDRPRLADLRDSGNIEQDADNVVFLWRRERGDEYLKVEPRTLTVAKHRNGECVEMDLMFDKEHGSFYETAPESSGPPAVENYYRGGGR
jgi:replicative DNA helicase